MTSTDAFDLFICHASEDKDLVVRPLARLLIDRGVRVWLDELELTIGDSLHGRIESGLSRSRFGAVVISPAFFAKEWPQKELAGLAAREGAGRKVILPVWHEVDREYIAERSPILADRLGATTQAGIEDVADKISHALERADDGRSLAPVLAPPPGGPSRRKPGNMRRGSLMAAATFVALATVAGFAFGALGAPSRRPSGLPNSAATASYELSYPGSWHHALSTGSLPGADLTDPIGLETASGNAAMLAGLSTSKSETLLPDGLLSELSSPPVKETIRIDKTSGYRYRGLRPSGSLRPVTVYAIPTSAGVLLEGCVIPETAAGDAETKCEQIASSTRLLAAHPLPLGPLLGFASALDAAIGRLNLARHADGEALASSRTAVLQSAAASRLARAHREAAASVESTDPGAAERGASERIVAALRAAARSYALMSGAARGRDGSAYERGRRDAASADRELSTAIDALRTYGYRIAS
jgi:hypothetical protein